METISSRLPADLTKCLKRAMAVSRLSLSTLIHEALEPYRWEHGHQHLLAVFTAEAAALGQEEISMIVAKLNEAEAETLDFAEQPSHPR